MRDVAAVKVAQYLGYAYRERQELVDADFLAGDQVLERTAVEILENQGDAVFIIDDILRLDDVFHLALFYEVMLLPEPGDVRGRGEAVLENFDHRSVGIALADGAVYHGFIGFRDLFGDNVIRYADHIICRQGRCVLPHYVFGFFPWSFSEGIGCRDTGDLKAVL
jgi:hypothetical protein